MPLMSQTDYAKKRGVSQRYIAQLIKSGKIPGFALRKVGKRIHVYSEKADKALSETVDPTLRKPAKKQKSKPRPVTKKEKKDTIKRAGLKKLTLNEAKTGHEQYKMALKKLDYEQRIGELLPTREVKAIALGKARTVRDAILNVPDRLSSILAAETDPQAVSAILGEELRATLEELSR